MVSEKQDTASLIRGSTIRPSWVEQTQTLRETGVSNTQTSPHIALLTGGDDRPYALGMASALIAQGVVTDFIGSDALDAPLLHSSPLMNFLNLRGNQSETASFGRKIVRILTYYGRLAWYAATAKPRVFHILWNNKFEFVDRVLFMLYYRLLGKRIVFTAHNVNAAKRDSRDSWINRLTLRIQYLLCNHIFVHTQRMKGELITDFGIRASKVSVIPFGINDTIPTTEITTSQAKQQLGVRAGEKTLLFFGQIAPYKGLEYLIAALAELARKRVGFRLIIAGKVKMDCTDYWEEIQRRITQSGIRDRVIERIKHIPDEEVELYFKAADVLIIPYIHIFQSGVPFLAYSFGLPVIATDVGSLKEDIIEGKTGFVCRPQDPTDLAKCIETYFASDLYQHLETRRQEIREVAHKRHSWAEVGEITTEVYKNLLART